MQEYLHNLNRPQSKEKLKAFDGKLPGQLQLILSVIDLKRQDAQGKPCRYYGALVELLQSKNTERPSDIYRMFKVKPWSKTQARNPRSLSYRRFYSLTTILRSAHLIPTSHLEKGAFYINNYVDWHQYNTLYDKDFLAKGTREADRIAKSYGRI